MSSMRSRGGAVSRRVRPTIRPVYEDFKPESEWMQDGDGSSVLVYRLPGFVKDQIKVIAESRGILRVRGERQVASNKWSRFQDEVKVPEHCNMKEIRAKFEGGILRITMPKKITTTTTHKLPSQEQSSKTSEPPRSSAPSPIEPPRSSAPTPQEPPRASALSPYEPPRLSSPSPYEPPRSSSPTPYEPPRSSSPASYEPPRSSAPSPYEPPKSSSPSPYEPSRASAPTPYEPSKPSAPTSYEPPRASAPTPYEPPKSSAPTPYEPPTPSASSPNDEVYGDALDQVKSNFYDLKKVDKFGGISQLMKRLDQDRQLLINMGVAVLVIVALGANIAYSKK